MNELSLFTGCGGGLLGTKLLGWRHIGYVENNEFCQKLIAQRIKDGIFEEAPIFTDIRDKETVDFFASLSYKEEKLRKENDMPAHRKPYLDEAAKLYRTGLSLEMVAEHYGVTRQSMYKALRRRGVEFRSRLKYGQENHFYRGGHRAEDRIQNMVEWAVEKGTLLRPKKCETCGATGKMADGRSIIQAHHNDYNKPLEIDWLCQQCHHEWHKKNRATLFEEEKEVGGKCDVITAGFP